MAAFTSCRHFPHPWCPPSAYIQHAPYYLYLPLHSCASWTGASRTFNAYLQWPHCHSCSYHPTCLCHTAPCLCPASQVPYILLGIWVAQPPTGRTKWTFLHYFSWTTHLCHDLYLPSATYHLLPYPGMVGFHFCQPRVGCHTSPNTPGRWCTYGLNRQEEEEAMCGFMPPGPPYPHPQVHPATGWTCNMTTGYASDKACGLQPGPNAWIMDAVLGGLWQHWPLAGDGSRQTADAGSPPDAVPFYGHPIPPPTTPQ